MIRLISVCAALVSLLALSISVDAQGRPGGAGQGAGSRPSMGQQRHMGASMRQQAEMRRQEAEARRLVAEAKRQEAEARKAEAEAKRAAGAEHNRSEDMRELHPPDEHAADEAFLAEANAENQNLRDERPDLRGDNRGDHGRDSDDDDQT